MKGLIPLTSLVACIGFALSTFAQTPASVTATCKDGSSFNGTTRSGACRGHGGVQTWGSATTAPADRLWPLTSPLSSCQGTGITNGNKSAGEVGRIAFGW
jgi:hypothetical protein